MTANTSLDSVAAARHLLDRDGVRDAVERYFITIDRRDWDGLADVFTADARVEMFDGEVVLEGRPNLIPSMRRIETFAHTCHMVGNLTITLAGNEAATDVFAIAYCVEKPVGVGKVLVRGLRYVDRIVREADRWRIALRRHIPLWQYEAPSQMPTSPGALLGSR